MALPAGVVTCTVTFGSAVDWSGDDVSISAVVTPTHDLVWAATGQPLISFPVVREAAAGVPGQIVLPVTDQPGFIDAAGAAFTGWAYSVALAYSTPSAGRKTVTKAVQPVTGQTVVDLDLVPSGGITTPVAAPIPPVTSVNGQTGAVVIAGGGGAVDSVNGQTGAVVLDAADVGGVAGLNGATGVWIGTQTEYDAIPAPRPLTVVYFITGA